MSPNITESGSTKSSADQHRDAKPFGSVSLTSFQVPTQLSSVIFTRLAEMTACVKGLTFIQKKKKILFTSSSHNLQFGTPNCQKTTHSCQLFLKSDFTYLLGKLSRAPCCLENARASILYEPQVHPSCLSRPIFLIVPFCHSYPGPVSNPGTFSARRSVLSAWRDPLCPLSLFFLH